jgi:hypothetical protein
VAHRLSEEERQRILLTCNGQEFAALPPWQRGRQLLKQHQYDPKSAWSSNSDWKPKGKPNSTTDSPDKKTNPSFPISIQAHDLALTLQNVVDQLLDIRPQWEGDHRVTELIDAHRLNELSNQLCAGRDLGWEF